MDVAIFSVVEKEVHYRTVITLENAINIVCIMLYYEIGILVIAGLVLSLRTSF